MGMDATSHDTHFTVPAENIPAALAAINADPDFRRWCTHPDHNLIYGPVRPHDCAKDTPWTDLCDAIEDCTGWQDSIITGTGLFMLGYHCDRWSEVDEQILGVLAKHATPRVVCAAPRRTRQPVRLPRPRRQTRRGSRHHHLVGGAVGSDRRCGMKLTVAGVTPAFEGEPVHNVNRPRMNEAQRNALWALCGRYGVPFREDDYRVYPPDSWMMKGYVEGWIGGRDGSGIDGVAALCT